MRQIQVTKVSRTRSQRRAALLDPLPLDPRDPDIAKAKQLQRDNSGRGDQSGDQVGGDR
jgi:hypothetical protein